MTRPEPPKRRDLLVALRQAERMLRWGGSLLILPGWVRLRFLNLATELAELLERADQRSP